MSLDLERRLAERAALVTPDDPRARARAALTDLRSGGERIEQWVTDRLHGRSGVPVSDGWEPRCPDRDLVYCVALLRGMARALLDTAFDTPYVWGPYGVFVVKIEHIVGFGVSLHPTHAFTTREPGEVWGLAPWRTWAEQRLIICPELHPKPHVFVSRPTESFKDTYARGERLRQIERVRRWSNASPRTSNGLTDREGFSVEQARIFAGLAPLG